MGVQDIAIFRFEENLEAAFKTALEDEGLFAVFTQYESLGKVPPLHTLIKVSCDGADDRSFITKPNKTKEFMRYDATLEIQHSAPRVHGNEGVIRDRLALSRYVFQRSRTAELFPETLFEHIVIESIGRPGPTEFYTPERDHNQDRVTHSVSLRFAIKPTAWSE